MGDGGGNDAAGFLPDQGVQGTEEDAEDGHQQDPKHWKLRVIMALEDEGGVPQPPDDAGDQAAFPES